MPSTDTGLIIAGGAGNAYDAGSNPLWTDTANITDPSLNFATITLPSSTWSKQIYADNFGFNVPTGFPVLGISLTVAMWCQRTANVDVVSVYVNEDAKDVFTINNSSNGIFGNEDIPNFYEERVYGDSIDLWGQDGSIDAAYVNNPTFGVAIKVHNYDFTNTNEVRFYWVKMRIYHLGPLGVLTSSVSVVAVKSTIDKNTIQLVKPYTVTAVGEQLLAANDGALGIGDLRVKYSGGGSTNVHYDSLGGEVSSATPILSQNLSRAVDNTKAVLIDAYGNPYGDGTLTFTPSSPPTYEWTPPDVLDPPQQVIAKFNKAYTIGDSSTGLIEISHDNNTMPSTVQTDTIAVGKPSRNTLFADIGYSSIVDGDTTYICVYLHNISAMAVLQVSLWVEGAFPPSYSIELGLDPAGLGDGVTNGVATVIVSPTDVPSGVAFAQYNASSKLSVGSMQAGDMQALWVKRVVPIGTPNIKDFELTDLTIEALV